MMLKRNGSKPRFTEPDRIFWVAYSKLISGWQSFLETARPRTVVDWNKRRFKRYWANKSRNRGPSRPRVSQEIQELICTMSRANPTWGTPQIIGMGIREVKTAFRSPWQNPYCERVIGSIRRDCLDHVIIFKACWNLILITTITADAIYHWSRIARNREQSNHQNKGKS